MSIPVSRLIVLKDRLESTDDALIKKTLKELSRVDMTFDMLKETGIGIAVNQLRYHENLGSMARQLVADWKERASAGDSGNNGNAASTYSERNNDYEPTTRRAHVRQNNRQSSSSQSPPPVSKKSKFDDDNQRDKTKKKSSSKTRAVPMASQDDEDEGKFTAECGSFEQILGLNDATQRISSSAVKSKDYSKKVKKQKYDDRSMSNGDSRGTPTKKQKTTTESSPSKTTASSADWSKVLPTKLTTEYRPQPQRALIADFDDDNDRSRGGGGDSDSDAVDFSTLKNRKLTKIYSGRRNIFLQHVPSLFESCIHVLCDNIDALGYTGGVPFDILKPVLVRASAAQLYKIEEWNPYLLEDTGDLWHDHCNREFKGVEPDYEEGETWRELYERMLAERDKKFNKLKSVISEQKAAKESAVRQAKMAMATAPREVRRRQMKYGTYRKETKMQGTEQIVQARKNLDTQPGAKGAGRQFSHIYEEEQRQKEQPKNRQGKVAPLMAKSLKMMKLSRARN